MDKFLDDIEDMEDAIEEVDWDRSPDTKPKRKKPNQDLIDVDFDDILAETPKAILFFMGDSKMWLPKSQIKELDLIEHTFMIPEWLAIEKDLI